MCHVNTFYCSIPKMIMSYSCSHLIHITNFIWILQQVIALFFFVIYGVNILNIFLISYPLSLRIPSITSVIRFVEYILRYFSISSIFSFAALFDINSLSILSVNAWYNEQFFDFEYFFSVVKSNSTKYNIRYFFTEYYVVFPD